jgi:ATP-dependent helicase HrpA
VVTSATIDAERFARHFARRRRPAPVIQVSGRLYPVELRWRPFEESRELRPERRHRARPSTSSGAEAPRRHPRLPARRARDPRRCRPPAPAPRQQRCAAAARSAEVLPLFARLSQAEQERVFQSGNGRRIVLATNVAETSLTVPGIRYVIDSGFGAREALQLPQQGGAAADRAGQPGRGQPARRALRPRGRRHLHPALRRGRHSPGGRVSPTRRSCAPRWPG